MVEKKDYNYYIEVNSIRDLSLDEKEFYLSYLENAYKEDFTHAKNSLETSPKWTIIAGYYAMHNISKYYLGLKFNKKLTLPNIHSATIQAIKEFITNNKINEILEKIEKYDEIEPLYFELRKGRDERSKTQYYINKYKSTNNITYQKAKNFIENIVEKYITVLESLIEK